MQFSRVLFADQQLRNLGYIGYDDSLELFDDSLERFRVYLGKWTKKFPWRFQHFIWMVCHNTLFLPVYFFFSFLGTIGFSINRLWWLHKSGYETLLLMVWNKIVMKKYRAINSFSRISNSWSHFYHIKNFNLSFYYYFWILSD